MCIPKNIGNISQNQQMMRLVLCEMPKNAKSHINSTKQSKCYQNVTGGEYTYPITSGNGIFRRKLLQKKG